MFDIETIELIVVAFTIGGIWAILRRKAPPKINARLSVLEDDIRRARKLIIEMKSGDEYALSLDGICTDITRLYTFSKDSEAANRLMKNCEDVAQDIIRSIEYKDEPQIRRTICSLRMTLGDLRSEFRR